MASVAPANDPRIMNAQARSIVNANSVKMKTQIFSGAVNPATQNVLNIQPRNVGLILGFLVEVSGTILNTVAGGLTLSAMGSANALSRIAFNDLNNVQRINTTGYHLALLNSARQGFAFGGAYAPNLPIGYGNNYGVFTAPATIASGANTGNVRHVYYVPLAYAQDDLRGAVYASVVNAVMNLQLTINQNPCTGTAPAADPLPGIYSGNAAGNWQGNVNVTVTQVYLDQIPQVQGQPILPMMDLNTIYDLKYTVQTGMVANQDFPVSYANFRQFLSTFMIYDQAGTFNAGTDINYWMLQAANSTPIWKEGPLLLALEARQTFMADLPAGFYYADSRLKPIDTITWGNQQIVLNASTTTAGASLVIGYEAFQQTSQIAAASSLQSGS